MTHSLSSKIDLSCLLKHFYLLPKVLFLLCLPFAKSTFILYETSLASRTAFKLSFNEIPEEKYRLTRSTENEKLTKRRAEDPQASYKLNNIQIVTNDALLRKQETTQRKKVKSALRNQSSRHYIAQCSTTIASVRTFKSLSYALHQLVFLLTYFFLWQLVAPCHVAVWTMINIFYPFPRLRPDIPRSVTWEKWVGIKTVTQDFFSPEARPKSFFYLHKSCLHGTLVMPVLSGKLNVTLQSEFNEL